MLSSLHHSTQPATYVVLLAAVWFGQILRPVSAFASTDAFAFTKSGKNVPLPPNASAFEAMLAKDQTALMISTIREVQDIECADRSDGCLAWTSLGFCEPSSIYSPYVRFVCPSSCLDCGPDSDICNEQDNKMCVGNDILDAGRFASSSAACCALCEATSGCKAWTWNRGIDQHCWVKTSCASPSSDSRYISGVASGPSPPTPVRSVCNQAGSRSGWPFEIDRGTHPSCQSSGGGTNDLGNTPHMCSDDLASVRIQTTPGRAECLVAKAPQCKIPMHDFVSLDYDFAISGCDGIWATLLWMTPTTWQWDGGSGEIDAGEMCPRGILALNFAGGGHQIKEQPSRFSISNSHGHITVRKDETGIVTIADCYASDAAANGGQCPKPHYNDCADCQSERQSFACWCNEPQNIYGSGGCQPNTDCMWHLVSDLWNGVHGDSGYLGCMKAVPGVVGEHQPNLNSNCAFSVQNIKLRGGGENGRLRWGEGSPSECDVLTV